MTVQIGIVLATFLIFVVLILSGKVKIDLVAMAIPIILEVTRVLEFGEAWSGLVNNSVIMMASMFIVGAAVGKTSLLGKMSGAIIKPGASDLKIMIGITIPILFLGNFVNGVATLSIVIPMIVGICAEQQRPVSKFIYPACVLAHIWPGFLPTGSSDTLPALSRTTRISSLFGFICPQPTHLRSGMRFSFIASAPAFSVMRPQPLLPRRAASGRP